MILGHGAGQAGGIGDAMTEQPALGRRPGAGRDPEAEKEDGERGGAGDGQTARPDVPPVAAQRAAGEAKRAGEDQGKRQGQRKDPEPSGTRTLVGAAHEQREPSPPQLRQRA